MTSCLRVTGWLSNPVAESSCAAASCTGGVTWTVTTADTGWPEPSLAKYVNVSVPPHPGSGVYR